MADAILNPCVIYALFSSEDGEIRYIGQTKRAPDRRLAGHLTNARKGATHRAAWIRSVLTRGHNVELFVLRTHAEWSVDERALIAAYRALGCRLVNATAGGDGVRDPHPEVRRKIGEKNRARKRTAQERAAMSARSKAAGISAEQRAKMVAGLRIALAERGEEISQRLSAARMGHQTSLEARRKIGAANLGKTHSDATRARLSAINATRFASDDERIRTAEATRKAMQRPEVRAKVGAASAAMWGCPDRRAAQSRKLTELYSDPAARARQSEKRGKLTVEQVIEARRMRKDGAALKELCATFGIGMGPMSMLCRGLTFRHVPLED